MDKLYTILWTNNKLDGNSTTDIKMSYNNKTILMDGRCQPYERINELKLNGVELFKNKKIISIYKNVKSGYLIFYEGDIVQDVNWLNTIGHIKPANFIY